MPSVPSLSATLEEIVGNALTFRIGPDRLPKSVLDDTPSAVYWIAYWYRSHRHCPPSACRCWTVADAARARILSGEGIAIVRYRSGDFHVLALRHAGWEEAINWDQVESMNTRFTVAELHAQRHKGLEFVYADGHGDLELPDEAHDVWHAYDAACASAEAFALKRRASRAG